MIYNLLTLGFQPGQIGNVMPKLPAAIAEFQPHGTLLGCFTAEMGALNRITVLTGYEDTAALAEDRGKIAAAGNPLGLAEYLIAFDQAAYAPMPFLPPLAPGAFGPFYEIRTYAIKAGAFPAITEDWAKVYEARNAISPLLLVMGSLDTAPQRMVHIWPYHTLDGRSAARGEAAKTGIWPPKSAPGAVLSMQSELFIAAAFSPLS